MAYKLVSADGPQSVPALLHRNAKQFANAPAYREKEFGIWQSWTWSQTRDEVEALALGFLELGANEGDFIAIIGRNRPYLYWAMMAAEMVGAVPVPLYQDANAEEMAYVLDHCGARFVIAGDQEQVDKVLASRILSAASWSNLIPLSVNNASNSPDRVISVMMSHPPTNSPLT